MRPGTMLSPRYRIERVLGQGGVGIVVVARDLTLRRTVAIKLLREDGDKESNARFLREAHAAARLTGEHVVRVHDVGRTASGAPMIVMEYLEGHDLAHALRAHGGKIPVRTAVDWILQACEGVAEAHALGIVHRDLKPSNLFLTKRPNGTPIVKVVDFGLAKTVNEDRKITATAVIVGSPDYMSPEQLRSSPDLRTDIWSIGVCLYELSTGRAPFAGASIADLMANILSATQTSAEDLAPEIPSGLSQAIDLCLAKDPSARPSDVAVLAELIEPYGSPASQGATERIRAVLARADDAETIDRDETQTTSSIDAVPRRSRASLAAVLAIACALVLGTAVVAWWARQEPKGTAAVEPRPSIAAAPPPSFSPGVAGTSIASADAIPIPIPIPIVSPSALPIATTARARGKPMIDAGARAHPAGSNVDPAAQW